MISVVISLLTPSHGHLGDHTYSHPNIGDIGVAAFLADIDWNDGFLKDVDPTTGNAPSASPTWKKGRTRRRGMRSGSTCRLWVT